MRRPTRLRLWFLVIAYLVCSLVSAPFAHASAPGPQPGQTPAPVVATSHPTKEYLDWLAKKRAHRVRSGINVTQGKGAKTQPFIVTSSVAAAYPAAALLDLQPTTGVMEPSDGLADHLPDANGIPYGDHDFFDLCGPGAADVTLWYWPNPNNSLTSYNVIDTATNPVVTLRPQATYPTGAPIKTTWKSDRMRGYMTYLAWRSKWPGSSRPGVQDNTGYWTYGATLQDLRSLLNWEASGYNSSTWSNYFYAIEWNNHTPGSSSSSWISPGVFQADIMDDIAVSHVPVLAEVDAHLLGPRSNWSNTNYVVHHFIAIVGYDNNNGTYTYLDTCGQSTSCNPDPSNNDAQPHTIPQSDMWNAMAGVTMDQNPAPGHGDGGYIW